MHFDYSQHKQQGFTPIFILIGALIMVGVAGGAYYLGRTTSPKPELQNQVVTSSPQPSPSIDETANWKTYTNIRLGFQIKYPLGWSYRSEETTESSPVFESPDMQRDQYTPDLLKGNFMFVKVENNQETLDQIEQKMRSYKPPPNAGGPTISSIERTKLFGYNAIRDISQYGSEGLRYTFLNSDRKYEIVCNYVIGNMDGKQLCEKIVLTFKFLE